MHHSPWYTVRAVFISTVFIAPLAQPLSAVAATRRPAKAQAAHAAAPAHKATARSSAAPARPAAHPTPTRAAAHISPKTVSKTSLKTVSRAALPSRTPGKREATAARSAPHRSSKQQLPPNTRLLRANARTSRKPVSVEPVAHLRLTSAHLPAVTAAPTETAAQRRVHEWLRAHDTSGPPSPTPSDDAAASPEPATTAGLSTQDEVQALARLREQARAPGTLAPSATAGVPSTATIDLAPSATRAARAALKGHHQPDDITAPPETLHLTNPAKKNIAAQSEPPQLEPEVAEALAEEALDSNSSEASVKLVPAIIPNLYNQNGRLVVPAALKGSHEILVHQNLMATQDGLDRIQDDDQLAAMRRQKLLVALPDNSAIQVDNRLPVNRRFARPWTARFLADLARAHYTRFHNSLQINSAVRTVDFQRRLMRTNGNAAAPTGETASPHLTGQAVDLAKRGMSMTEIAWMRGYLLPLIQQGKIDVEEEFQQSCFHISVYRRYMPSAIPPQRTIERHRNPAQMLATTLP